MLPHLEGSSGGGSLPVIVARALVSGFIGLVGRGFVQSSSGDLG